MLLHETSEQEREVTLKSQVTTVSKVVGTEGAHLGSWLSIMGCCRGAFLMMSPLIE